MRRALLALVVLFLACAEQPSVKATPQRIEIVPASLDFGVVPVRGGRALQVEVTNVGQGAASVRVEPGELPFEIEPWQFSLGAGEAMEVSIRFRPRREGLVADQIPFRTGDGSEVPLAVEGRGVERVLRIEPSEIDFGKLHVGTTERASFTLESTADGTLDLLFRAGGSPDFSIDTEPLSIAGGTSTTLELIYAPETIGGHAGWIDISPCTDCLPERIRFEGIGIAEELAVLPSRFDFGAVPPGYGETIEALVRNGGDAPALLEVLRLEGAHPALELVVDASLPRTLAPKEEVAFQLHFRPETEAHAFAVLVVATERNEKRISVSGRGGGPFVEAEEFFAGPYPVGYQRVRWARLKNRGEEATIEVEAVELDDPSGVFSLAEPDALPAWEHDGLGIPIRVNGTAPGTWEATLRVHLRLPFQPAIEIPLRAHFAQPECELRFDPPSPIHLGIVDGTRDFELEVEVVHDGEGECLIWEPRFEGDANGLELASGAISSDFLLLEPGGSWRFHWTRARRFATLAPELHALFVLSHSEIGVQAEVPVSFLQAAPMPIVGASMGSFPATPVGKTSVGWAWIQPEFNFMFDDPPLTIHGSEEFELAFHQVAQGFPIAFTPTSSGKKEADIRVWMRNYGLPYLMPSFEAEALPPCPEPCVWPEASCEWELIEGEAPPPWGWVRQIRFQAEVAPAGGLQCYWFRENGSRGQDCEGIVYTVPPEGGAYEIRAFFMDEEGRAASCEAFIELPPLEEEG